MECLYRVSPLEEVRGGAFTKVIVSPVGPLTLVATESALVALSWGNGNGEKSRPRRHEILDATEAQLKEYFTGKRRKFEIPLVPHGTDFQKRVWAELSQIPYGEVITYGEQARRIGNPKASRAVGAANGRNPIGILIPCHRVVGASGALTGFAGGLEIKRRLLAREGASY